MDKLADVYIIDHGFIKRVIQSRINQENINILIKSPTLNNYSFLYCICLCLNQYIIADSADFIIELNKLINIYNKLTNIKINELKHKFENNSPFPFNIIIFNIELSEFIIINSLIKTKNNVYMIYFNNCYSLIKIYSTDQSIKYIDFDEKIYNNLKKQLQTNTSQLQTNTSQLQIQSHFQDIITFPFTDTSINGHYLKNVIYHHIGHYRNNMKINYRPTIGDGRCFINAIIMHLYKTITPGTLHFTNEVNKLIWYAENYIHTNTTNKHFRFDGGQYNLNPEITDIANAIVHIIKKNIIIISDDARIPNSRRYSSQHAINIIGFRNINDTLLKSFDDVIYILGYDHHFTLLQFESPHMPMNIFNFLLNKAQHGWFESYKGN